MQLNDATLPEGMEFPVSWDDEFFKGFSWGLDANLTERWGVLASSIISTSESISWIISFLGGFKSSKW